MDSPASQPKIPSSAWPFGPSYAVEIDPDRDLVFLGTGGVVMILDGSDLTAPTLITDEIRTQGLVEDIAFDSVNLRLFIACGEGGMEIWDISTPALPSRLSVTEVLYFGYGSYEVFGTPEVAYVGHGGTIVILDLLIQFFPPWSHFDRGGVGGLEVRNGIAYIINGIGLRLFDVRHTTTPSTSARWPRTSTFMIWLSPMDSSPETPPRGA